MIDYNTIDPLHHNLLKGKDMTAAETHTIEKEYFEMKKDLSYGSRYVRRRERKE
jgi:hypothetical protein